MTETLINTGALLLFTSVVLLLSHRVYEGLRVRARVPVRVRRRRR